MNPRQNTTRCVILGVLNLGGAMSGYQIQRWIARRIDYFWSESFGQIYPELKKLAAAGLIAAAATQSAGGRARQAFRITPRGRRALCSWLQQAASPEPVRIEYLLKLFFGHEVDAAVNQAHITAVEQRNAVRVRNFSEIRRLLAAENPSEAALVYWLIVLRHGQLVSQARRRWAQESLELMTAYERGGNRKVLAALKKLEREDP